MKVVIAGGSGFLGSALASSLRVDGHQITIITRHPQRRDQAPWTDLPIVAEGADVVVNLAGEPLEAGRWTEARKKSLLQSRLKATDAVVTAMSKTSQRPAVFVNASAIGYYGARGAGVVTEESPPGSDFLASVCVAWEGAAMAAAGMMRVVLLRTGLVLDRNAGALPKLALPFRVFAGGRVGSGDQSEGGRQSRGHVAHVDAAVPGERADHCRQEEAFSVGPAFRSPLPPLSRAAKMHSAPARECDIV